MKIERQGNTFTIEVAHHAHAETLDALLRVIKVCVAGDALPHPFGPNTSPKPHPLSGLTLTVGVNPWLLSPHAEETETR